MTRIDELYEELWLMADWLREFTKGMDCCIGNSDGWSTECEHCQLVDWMNRIDALFETEEAGAP